MDVGPLFAQGIDNPHQVIIGPDRSMHRPDPRPCDEYMFGRRLADDQRKILVLAEVAMEERQLLMAVGGIIRGVQIQRDRWRAVSAVVCP